MARPRPERRPSDRCARAAQTPANTRRRRGRTPRIRSRLQLTGRAVRPAVRGRRAPIGSDADYLLDLCDEAIGETGLRKHELPWLLSDPDPEGRGVPEPVAAYWPGKQIVAELVKDERREHIRRRVGVLTAYGVATVVLDPTHFAQDGLGALRRLRDRDMSEIRGLLSSQAIEHGQWAWLGEWTVVSGMNVGVGVGENDEADAGDHGVAPRGKGVAHPFDRSATVLI